MCSRHSYKALHVLSHLILTKIQYADEETGRWTKRASDFPTITQLVRDDIWFQSLFSRKTEKYTEITLQSINRQGRS